MNARLILLALFVLCLLGGFATEGKTPEPRARFDFEKFDAKKRAVNVASKGMPFTSFGGDFVFGEGVDSSSAAHVTKGRCPQSEFTTIDFRAFTLDLRFKLDGAVDTAQGNALFSYSWAPWNRGNFMVRISRDSRVEVRFLRERRKDDPKIDWKVVSDVQEIAANVYNALRVSCTERGLVIVYLNGTEIARKEGAPGLNDIRSESPKWYPLVRLPPKGCAPLWIEFDSRGLPAGRHSLVLRLKKSRMGFRSLTIPVEVTIVDKDLDAVPFDKAAYDHLHRPSAKYDRMAEFAAEHCGNVMVTGSWPGAFAKKLKDGSWQKPDFAELDRRIDARLKGGVPKEKFVLWYCIALNLYWNGPKKANGSVNSDLADPEWHEGIKATVLALRDHLREKYAMGYGQLIFYVVDEPEADGNIDDPKLKDTMAIAYRSAKTIKEADPKLRTFTNPHTSGALKTDIFLKTLKRLEGVIDIIEFYRPNIGDNHDFIAKLKDLKFEYWTYSILDTRTHPSVWRSDVWRNMRDGFRELTPYRHFDAMAGGDGFDPSDTGSADGGDYVDYGTAYVDYDQGRVLGSRRLAAWELGLEDAKLIKFLRAKYAKDAAKLAEIEKIVKTAADKGDMKSMDHARGLLLRCSDAQALKSPDAQKLRCSKAQILI